MDLFADYLLRRAPNNGLKPSRTTAYPFYVYGGGWLPTGLSHHVKASGTYWEALAASDQAWASWLGSDDAFRSPTTFRDLGDVPFPDHVTPWDVAAWLLPEAVSGPRTPPVGSPRYLSLLTAPRGLECLVAFCSGWPLTPPEKDLAREAAQALPLDYRWVLFAEVDASPLPLPFDPDVDLLVRMQRHALLTHNPLALPKSRYDIYLPEVLKGSNDILARLRDLLPPRTAVAGSTKTPKVFRDLENREQHIQARIDSRVSGAPDHLRTPKQSTGRPRKHPPEE